VDVGSGMLVLWVRENIREENEARAEWVIEGHPHEMLILQIVVAGCMQ